MKALFAGSFDPFTIGHKSIVDRALGLFDTVVIGFGVNVGKTPWMPLADRLEAVKRLYAGNQRVEVEVFEGLAVDFARSIGARAMVRGVRSVADFEYERNLADTNRLLTPSDPIETVLLPALPELAPVSSSMVRELARFGADYSRFLPSVPQ